jgi:hypothetical protein
MKQLIFIVACLLCVSLNGQTQEQDSLVEGSMLIKKTPSLTEVEPNFKYDPLRPAKAAFYSAIVPGLGQAYNKKYWKIPLVYAAIGTTMYFYVDNNNLYNTYREAYRLRLIGQVDQFSEQLTDQNLIDAQTLFRKNRDLSLLFVVGAYILNIVDANVDAHLSQFNVSDNLSFKPNAEQDFMTGRLNFGLSFNFKLN